MSEQHNKQRAKTIVIVVIMLALSSFVSLAVGLRSGVQQDRLFHFVRDVKYLVIPPGVEYREQWKLNKFGQLTWYHAKTEVSNPVITDKTLVAFVFGQSNSANHGGERYTSKDQKVLNYFGDKFYVAADPLLGATGLSGSVWTNLGNKIVANNLADNVVLIPAGVGSSSVKEWQDGGRLNKMLRERLKDAKEKNLNVSYFLWHQGEADKALDPKQYTDGLNNVIDLTKSYFPESKFFVAKASRCGTVASSTQLLKAQESMARREGVYIGPNTDKIDLEDRYDDCHFSGRGLEAHAEGWIEALKKSIK